MQRVIAYIDGHNFYHGLRELRWERFYWLNYQELARQLLRSHQQLVFTKYFTTLVTENEARRERQLEYLDALQTLSDYRDYRGHFLPDTTLCEHCGHETPTHHEKMTDVNIAVEMLSDVYQNKFDVALLFSADSDLTNLVRTIRRFKNKYVSLVFPPARYSTALERVGGEPLHITNKILAKSQFPDEIALPNGHKLRRPERWR